MLACPFCIRYTPFSDFVTIAPEPLLTLRNCLFSTVIVTILQKLVSPLHTKKSVPTEMDTDFFMLLYQTL